MTICIKCKKYFKQDGVDCTLCYKCWIQSRKDAGSKNKGRKYKR